MTEQSTDSRLIYVADPMCSWCWGFAPVIERVREEAGVPVELMLGGLRPGPNAEAVDDRMREFLRHHWDQVAEATGQPFDRSTLERDGFIYDTEPPSVAVAAVRELDPQQAFPYFARLQRAFYAEAKDLGDPETLAILLSEFPVDIGDFLDLLANPETQRTTWEDFRRARKMGISGFPALIGARGDQLEVLSPGYLPYDRLAPGLNDWLGRD